MSSGHIPHSYSLPFQAFLQTSSTTPSYTSFLPPAEIHNALVGAVGSEQAESIIKGGRTIITSCGSGMTAAVLWLGLRLLGVEKIGLYDEVSMISVSPTRSRSDTLPVLGGVCIPQDEHNSEVAIKQMHHVNTM